MKIAPFNYLEKIFGYFKIPFTTYKKGQRISDQT